MTSAIYPDHIQLIISRAEVEAGEVQGPLSVLQQLATRDAALQFMERVAIAIDGYDDDPRELFEIPEVRGYVGKLDAGFPYWLFFLTKTSETLRMILLCFVPPCLKPEVHSVEGTSSMCNYLTKRGLPAMNHIASLLALPEHEVEFLTQRCMDYLFDSHR